MARTSLAVTALTANNNIAKPAGAAVDVANGHTIPANGKTQNLILEVANTFAGAKNVTIKAGANPPAFRSVADLVIAVPASSTRIISLPESAAYVQADGSLWVDYESGTTGTVIAYQLQ